MSSKRLVVFPAAIAAFLCLGAANDPSASAEDQTSTAGTPTVAQRMSLDQEGVSPVPSSQACDFDRVTISASGKFGTFWRREPDIRLAARNTETGDAVLVNLDCLRRYHDFQACQATHIESLGAIASPMFSENEDELTVRDARLGLVTHNLRSSDRGVSLTSSPGHALSGPQVAVLRFSGVKPKVGEGDSSGLKKSLSGMSDFGKSQLRLLEISLDRDGVQGSLAESTSSLELTVFDRDGRARQTNIPTSYLPYASVGRAVDGRVLLTADGVALTSDEGGELELVPHSAVQFQRPVIEASSGRVVGFFGEKSVKRIDGKTVSEWNDFRWMERSLKPGQYISDISVSTIEAGKAGKFVAVVGDLWGRRSIYLFDRDGGPTRMVLACGSSTDVPPIAEKFSNIGQADWPLWAKQYRGAGERNGLVVLMHGGPGSSGSFGNYAPTIRFYLREGYDVVVPEFSGSTGLGIEVTRRLVDSGPAALERDAILIRKYARGMRKHYKMIVTHAESYGAVPWLWSRSNDTTFDKSILLVPLLKLRDPEEWTHDHQLGSYSPGFQRLFEATFFGIGARRDILRNEVARRVSAGSRASDVLIIQARNDPISRPEDAVGLTAQGATIVELNTFHAAIEAEPQTWMEIRDFLGSSAESPPSRSRQTSR